MHVGHGLPHTTGQWIGEGAVVILCFASIGLYLCGMLISNRCGKHVPFFRLALWSGAMLAAAAAFAGPLAARAHADFTSHMLVHLLVGMVAPLLAVLAAPLTLLYRSIPTGAARRLTRVLKIRLLRILGEPTIASIMHVGGLWVLYATPLYEAMHQQLLVHVLVHVHFFLAGFLFTLSLIPIDPAPHRTRYAYRAIVLLLASAGHSILAKILYAHPPVGVPLAQAETGSVLMYYGGDAVGAVIIAVFCYQWYRAARPRLGAAPSGIRSSNHSDKEYPLLHQLPD